MAQFVYDPTVFERPTLEQAKRIVVTPQSGQDTEERWARETPYLADLIHQQAGLQPGQLVIDYGCGVGRIAKALVTKFGVRVLGVDSSDSMRSLAVDYTGQSGFAAVSRNMLQGLTASGMRADAAIAVWVLQHCPRPDDDVRLLSEALRPGAKLVVVNNLERVIPTISEDQQRLWVSDGLDVHNTLSARFGREAQGQLDVEVVGQETAETSFWATYRRT